MNSNSTALKYLGRLINLDRNILTTALIVTYLDSHLPEIAINRCDRSSIFFMLGCVLKLYPQHHASYREHSQIVTSLLFISSRNSAILLESIEASFHMVAFTIESLVKPALGLLVRLTRNRISNASTSQITSKRLTVISFISNDSLRSNPRTASSCNSNLSLLHQLLKHNSFMTFTHA